MTIVLPAARNRFLCKALAFAGLVFLSMLTVGILKNQSRMVEFGFVLALTLLTICYCFSELWFKAGWTPKERNKKIFVAAAGISILWALMTWFAYHHAQALHRDWRESELQFWSISSIGWFIATLIRDLRSGAQTKGNP